MVVVIESYDSQESRSCGSSFPRDSRTEAAPSVLSIIACFSRCLVSRAHTRIMIGQTFLQDEFKRNVN